VLCAVSAAVIAIGTALQQQCCTLIVLRSNVASYGCRAEGEEEEEGVRDIEPLRQLTPKPPGVPPPDGSTADSSAQLQRAPQVAIVGLCMQDTYNLYMLRHVISSPKQCANSPYFKGLF